MFDCDALLQEVGVILRMPLKLDPKTCRCTLRDKTSKQEYFIELPHHSPYLYLYSVLMRVALEQDSANFYRSLLEMNLFGLKTDTGSLSIDPVSRSVLLHLTFPMEFITPRLLVNLLTNFTATAKKLGAAVADQLLVCNKDVRKKRTHYAPAEGMDKKNPTNTMRVIRI